VVLVYMNCYSMSKNSTKLLTVVISGRKGFFLGKKLYHEAIFGLDFGIMA